MNTLFPRSTQLHMHGWPGGHEHDVFGNHLLPRDAGKRGPGARAAILLTLAFIGVVVSTPASAEHAAAAFGVYGLVLLVGAFWTGTPARQLIARVTFVAVFAAIAALPMPFIRAGRAPAGEVVSILGLDASRTGLALALGVVAKATLSVAAMTWLTALHRGEALLTGLARLRCPARIVALLGMVQRYGAVLTDEAGRMRRAAECRGYGARGRWVWRAGAVGWLAGSLFLRSYARAERVHHAMLLRGYDGTFRASGIAPASAPVASRASRWQDATVCAAGVGVALAARLLL